MSGAFNSFFDLTHRPGWGILRAVNDTGRKRPKPAAQEMKDFETGVEGKHYDRQEPRMGTAPG